MKDRLTAIIVDDETHALSNIRLLLQAYSEIEILAECTNGIEAINAIQKFRPQLVFLDIQMPELSGFDVIQRIKGMHQPYIIFTTAYDQYAIKAFEINAIDYLLKPFDDHRFDEAIQRAKSRLANVSIETLHQKMTALMNSVQQSTSQNFLKKIAIKSSNRVFFIDVKEVLYIEADNQYVNVCTRASRHLLRESLSHLSQSLDPEMFYRSHRSYLINLNRIKEIVPYFKGDYTVIMENDAKVKLSRNRTQGLKELLGW